MSYDQDTTDLHKCIDFICGFTPEVDKSNVSCNNIIELDAILYMFFC